MTDDLYVISDLHMGGPPGFQMLSPDGQAKLADFARWLVTLQQEKSSSTSADRNRVHLIVAGDVVDFLAEFPWTPFSDERTAVEKVKRILDSTASVWAHWKRLLEAGGRLTLMLGNHDLELTYRSVLDLLREKLGPGHLDLIFNNEALVIGDILIEHGNRYDVWNRIDHNGLREYHSKLSRREKPALFKGPPGSELVVELVNPTKADVDFVDLLKPERSGLLPLLGAISPKRVSQARAFVTAASTFTLGQVLGGRDGRPFSAGYVAGSTAGAEVTAETRIMPLDDLALLGEVAGFSTAGDVAGSTGGTDWIGRWDLLAPERQEQRLRNLYKALRNRREAAVSEFNADDESGVWKKAAQESINNGFKLVIYGHTHAVRRVSMEGGRYLNTGTWADLMRFPEEAFGPDEKTAIGELRKLVEDLCQNKSSVRRFQYPTFALIARSDPAAADVYLYLGGDRYVPVPSGYREPVKA